MLKNYFLVTLRNLQRNAVYSFINIFGLSVGIACSILILLWVKNETSYNRFHENYSRLYKVHMNRKFSGTISTQVAVPYPLKEALKNRSSQIKHVVITNWGEGNLLSVGDKKLNKLGLSASEDFFKMFSFKLLKGSSQAVLADPSSIVLTQSTAAALFGDQEALNQLVKIDNDRELKVTGIIEDVPSESSLNFDYVLPFSYYESTQNWVRNSVTNWENNSFQMYVELQPGAAIGEVSKNIEGLIKENHDDGTSAQVFLHPMEKWRLYSNFKNGKEDGGMIEYVNIFTAIAIFVLIIACINFMNLATARSESRAREVGVRKSVGSRKKQLIYQFLGESLIITLLAFLVAVMFVELALPAYNALLNKTLFIDYTSPLLWLSAGALVILTGGLAGSYPAFYLSSFEPVKALKGKFKVGPGATIPRKILVTLQFGFSIFLILGTVIMYQQIMHLKNRDIGYDRENLMMVWTNTELETGFESVRTELMKTGVVSSVCKSNSPITSIFASNKVEWTGMPPEQKVSFTTIATEYDYVKTMGIQLLEGRDFSRDSRSDSSAVLINKAAQDIMGFQNPLGEKVNMWGSEWIIIGVMENVVMGAADKPVEPLIMTFNPGWSSTISIRLEKTQDLQASIQKVENVFKLLNPSNPFEYRFADTTFEAKFTSVTMIGKLAGIFATLAIIITCLGLFGLAAFTAEQRTKEIGIRKSMGASVTGLVLLISRDFSKLVIFAFMVAAPLAWWVLNSFLQRYPYRIEISWWVLPAVGIVALMLALAIVSTQALKAATTNPVQSLRNE